MATSSTRLGGATTVIGEYKEQEAQIQDPVQARIFLLKWLM